MRDISEQRVWERRIKDEEENAEKTIQRLRNISRISARSFEELMGRLKNCLECLSQPSLSTEQSQGILRELHTAKGVARSLGFIDFSEAIHELESSILLSKKNPASEYDSMSARSHLENLWQSYRAVIHDKPLLQSAGEVDFDNLFAVVGSFLPDLEHRLAKVGLHLESVSLEDQAFPWSADDGKMAKEIVLHGLNNAIDHGYLRPQQAGKHCEQVRVQVLAKKLAAGVHLSISDEGVGLDTSWLKRKADELHFIPEPGGSYLDVAFCSEVSTAKDLTSTSGRGIGLAVVLQQAKNRGGYARLLPRDKGARLEVFLPTALPLKETDAAPDS